jgi:hypothetical protein
MITVLLILGIILGIPPNFKKTFLNSMNANLKSILVIILLISCDTTVKKTEPISICATGSRDKYQSQYLKIMQDMHTNMEQVQLVADDRINYLRQMIPHHQGAIEMSELIIRSTDDRRLINIAQGIITEQRNEIAIMNYLIQDFETDTLTRNK